MSKKEERKEEVNEASTQEATKQLTIGILGLGLLIALIVAAFKPENAQLMVGVAATIVTALAAVVRK